MWLTFYTVDIEFALEECINSAIESERWALRASYSKASIEVEASWTLQEQL